MGGSKESWEPFGEPFPAYVSTPSTKDRVYAMQLNTEYDRKLHAPFGVDVNKTDRIRFKSEDYEIVGDIENLAEMDEIIRIRLKKV